jgi:hypothetical protein
MAEGQARPRFAVCVANDGCDDLSVWRLYRVLPDDDAAREGYLRVVDDSGEDYLYPASRFVDVALSDVAEQKLLSTAPSSAGPAR